MNKVDASRRAEKCRSLRVQVEVGVSGCALRGRPRIDDAPQTPSRPRLTVAPTIVPAQHPLRPILSSARGSVPPQAPSGLPPPAPFRRGAPGSVPPPAPFRPWQAPFRPTGRLPSAPGSLAPQAPLRPRLPSAPGSLPPQPPFRPSLPSAPLAGSHARPHAVTRTMLDTHARLESMLQSPVP